MLGFLEKDPSHPFSSVPFLSSPSLQELKLNHVTFDLNVHVPTVTGILPHDACMQQINNVKEACEESKTEVRLMLVDLKTIVHEVINEKVEASGGINISMMDKRLGNMEKKLADKMDSIDVQTESTCVHFSHQNGEMNACELAPTPQISRIFPSNKVLPYHTHNILYRTNSSQQQPANSS